MAAAQKATDPALDPIVVRLAALPLEETLLTYIELVEAAPEKADTVALAIREQGRSGRIDASHVEALSTCVLIAPSSLCTGHLAKALATLGRAAAPASQALIDRMKPMVVTDDVEYWSFDGCVWALGYMGGDSVSPFLDLLEAENPSRAVRSQSIYRGVMPKEAREQAHRLAIKGARQLLSQTDPGVWRTRKSPSGPRRPDVQEKTIGKAAGKAWNFRSETPKKR